MSFEDYKVVLYRNQPDGWVAEIPAVPGCYALMPARDAALAELADVFEMIQAEYREEAGSGTALNSSWPDTGPWSPLEGK
jgi:predicted RNase H-like HicB family nuclease